jgi:dTDP-D-glucose 4,6-dehydratase
MEKIMLDVLGHPVTAGDMVLTGGYGTAGMQLVTEVVRTTPKAVYVNLGVCTYDWSNHRAKTTENLVRRRYDQVVVVDKQLAHNKKAYPEYLI